MHIIRAMYWQDLALQNITTTSLVVQGPLAHWTRLCSGPRQQYLLKMKAVMRR